MSDVTQGVEQEEDEQDSCDVCNKINETDFEIPPGWLLINVTLGDEAEDEDNDSLVCSLACAKAWFDREYGS